MKKLLLSFGAVASVAAPIVAVVSCGSTNESTNQVQPNREARVTQNSWDKYPDIMIMFKNDLKTALNGFKIAGQDIEGLDKMFTTLNDPHALLTKYNEVAKYARKLSDPNFHPTLDAAPANDIISQEAIDTFKNHVVFVLKNVVTRRHPIMAGGLNKFDDTASGAIVRIHQAALDLAKLLVNKDGGSVENRLTKLINAVQYNPSAITPQEIEIYAAAMRDIFERLKDEVFQAVEKLDTTSVESKNTIQDILDAANALCLDYTDLGHNGDNLVANKPNFGPTPTFDALNAQSLVDYKETLKKQLGLTSSKEIDEAKSAQDAYRAAWVLAVDAKSIMPASKNIEDFNIILRSHGLQPIR